MKKNKNTGSMFPGDDDEENENDDDVYRDPEPAPPYSDENTSKDAAHSMRPSAKGLRAIIQAWIESKGEYGATCDEAMQHFKLEHQTVSPRFWELKGNPRGRERSIWPNGRQRKTRAGRMAAVLVADPSWIPESA